MINSFHKWVFDNCKSDILRVAYFLLIESLVFILGFIFSPIGYLYSFWQNNNDIAECIKGVWNWNKEKQKSRQQLIQEVGNDNIKEL